MSNRITPELIKELRERTGVGMGQCKEALVLANGDMEKAIEHLRKIGAAAAIKKSTREAKEGMIGVSETPTALALVELNVETDFVIKNEKFQNFTREICSIAAKNKPATLEDFLHKTYASDASMTIDQYRNLLIQSFGENIQVRRLEVICKRPNCTYGIYSHMQGKIVTLVVIEGSDKERELAHDIAMHVAAEAPLYLQEGEVPEDIRKKEEEIARAQIKGKPPQVVDKIVEGKLKNYYDQNCLLNQKYVKDPSLTISQLVEKRAKELKHPLKLISFLRWQVGQR